MKTVEYGQGKPRVIVLLHGGGLAWWNYRAEAEALQANYHVVLPLLDGHAGSDRDFTSIEDNAAELLAYLDEHFGGRVEMIGGLSLGGQVLVETLRRRGDACRVAVIESALVQPMPFTHRLIGGSVKLSYGLIEKPWFARMQFRELHMDEALYPDYYRDSCAVTRENLIAILRANTGYQLRDGLEKVTAKTMILVGGREQKPMLDSAKKLQAALPGSRLEILSGYTHGALSLNHPEEYLTMLERAGL